MSRRRVASLVGVSAIASSLVVPSVASADPVIVAAGDIAAPSRPGDSERRTARLIRRIGPRAVLTLGDNQYNTGALSDYRNSYALSWGRFRRRTHPSPGNHDYGTGGARGYFDYFGRRARPRSPGMYSFNIGRWHLVSIDSGRGISDRQLRSVRRNLRRDRHRCEIAYWHHPRWSSGSEHGSDPSKDGLWRVLYRAGVDVVMNGHEHNYERFALMNPAGRRAPRNGIRQFTVGTGGRSHYRLGSGIGGSQVRIDDRFGVLRMGLHRRSYEWRFVAVGGRVMDRGSHRCHR